MIKLYFVNLNGELGVMDIPNFDACIEIKEPLIFVAFRDGNNFIKEPEVEYTFTDIERLIINNRDGAFDMSYVKESDYRRANTTLCPLLKPLEINQMLTESFSWNYDNSVDVQYLYEGTWIRFNQDDYYNSFQIPQAYIQGEYQWRLNDRQKNIYSPPVQHRAPH
jgi:hypothetical protein